MEGNRGTVCVTGGTGFIASWLVMRLLEHGYSVRTTVRPDPDGTRDISFLKNLPGASERLRILTAELGDPKSFGPAIDGCVGVFHVATPVDFEDREPEPVVTKRCIDGALGILRACLNSKTVKRVVYTSSLYAVQLNNSNADILDEDSWSDVDSIRGITRFAASYAISKTLTEKAVLEFGERHGLEVVTVIPSLVHGPFICPKFASSVQNSLALVLDKTISRAAHIFMFISMSISRACGRRGESTHLPLQAPRRQGPVHMFLSHDDHRRDVEVSLGKIPGVSDTLTGVLEGSERSQARQPFVEEAVGHWLRV
ncbi:hypothetical protein EUGRSUZ_E01430 [Eucalyptus grandis]|uniref:Uncharacterized protein n=2 Tax=Eucalyptus grandis TaxID=71139 RepID=A0ACC3KV62_EUCGR|nr:hypothetical protein EUGRSUZ_E01430 [Eucalyptus grandis]